MRLRTAICCISVLTSNFFSFLSYSNFSQDKWTYHLPNIDKLSNNLGDQVFDRCGKDLGTPLVDIQEISKVFSLKLQGKEDFELRKGGRVVFFSTRHDQVKSADWKLNLSTRPVWIHEKGKKKLCVPLDFGDRALTPLLTGIAPEFWDKHLQYVRHAQVVIDPGHGGNDWGASGNFKGESFKEKDLTLEFARELNGAFKEKGIESVLTRNQDHFVSLSERTSLVNKFKPKLFLSLHLNANGVGPGFEIFTLSQYKKDRKSLFEIGEKVSKQKEKSLLTFKSTVKQELSVKWAGFLKKILSSFLSPVKAGMRHESFFLLYAVDSPGILVELGHIDREEDMRFWLNTENRKETWKQIAAQFLEESKKSKF
jgi:N-acetylmuramoyl-L-alanine amidase